MESNYEQYAILDSEIKEKTKLRDSIKLQIVENMVDEGKEKEETAVGKFAIAKLKTWTYTEKVKELEEKYKAQKAQEESTGDATFVEKPSLRFSSIKL